MKNKKFIKVFDLITAIGMFVGGVSMLATAIFLKGDGKFMLFFGIIFCIFSFMRSLIKFENRPHKKDLDILLNDERNVQIRRIADSKALNFFGKLSNFVIIISMITLYFFHKDSMLEPITFNSSFWLGLIVALGVSSVALLIIKCYYVNKYSKEM